MLTQAEQAQQSQAGLEVYVGDLVSSQLGGLVKGGKIDPAVAKMLVDYYQGVVQKYGAASSVLASQQYMAQRVEAGVRDTFKPSTLLTPVNAAERVGWALLNATSPDGIDVDQVVSSLAVSAAKDAHDAGRDTIITNVKKDQQATAWARIPEPELTKSGTCAFCAMLAGRGAVYKSDTVKFLAHTAKGGKGHNCVCHAEPVFGKYQPSAQVQKYADLWQSAVVDQNRHGADARAAYRQAIEGREVTGLSKKAGSNTGGVARGATAPSPGRDAKNLSGLTKADAEKEASAVREAMAALPSASGQLTAAANQRLDRLNAIE